MTNGAMHGPHEIIESRPTHMFKLPFIKICSLLLLMALFGCSTESAVRGEEPVGQFAEFGNRYFESLKGQPLSDEVKSTENTHVKGQMDEWHTAKYEGSTVTYYRVVSEKRNILSSLEITSSSVLLPFGIHVGVSKSTIWNALGQPTSSTGNEATYVIDGTYAQTVAFKFSNNELVKVIWSHGID